MTESHPPRDHVQEVPKRILLCASATTAQETDACMDLLTVTEPSDENMLFISYLLSPDEVCTRWEEHSETWPAELGIIAANERTRSTPRSDADSAPVQPKQSATPVTIKTVAPGNLTQLGVHITEILTDWEAADEQIVVCFDSLTALTHHVDEKTLMRFLQVLSGHLQTVDAHAHFHLDPTAVDDQTTAQIKTIMDTVQRVTADDKHQEAAHE